MRLNPFFASSPSSHKRLIKKPGNSFPIVLTILSFSLALGGLFIGLSLSSSASASNHLNAGDSPAELETGDWVFIQNEGQFDERILFAVLGSAGNMFFTDDGMWLTLYSHDTLEESAKNMIGGMQSQPPYLVKISMLASVEP